MRKPLRVAVFVSGGGTNLQAIIGAVAQDRITNTELVLVVSNNPGVKALQRAADAGIPNCVLAPGDFESREAFHEALLARVQQAQVDLIVLAGFLVKIPEKLIAAYPNRIINIHPALIPSFCGQGYYGLKVHEAALARGVKLSGATVHFVNGDLDAGPILLQKAVEVLPGDTPEVLQRRVMEEAEWQLLPKAIDLIANGRVVVEDGKAKILEERDI